MIRPESKAMPEMVSIVIGEGGWRGRIDPVLAEDPPGSAPRVTIQPDDGGPTLTIPADLLVRQSDGTYRLPLVRSAVAAYAAEAGTVPGASAIATGERVVVPVIEETLQIGKRWVETGGGVRVKTTVTEHEETVDEPLRQESVVVERVPINRVVEAPFGPHEEGGTLIIPLFEETLVVEKRLLLREEVRITRQQTVERHERQTVPLRREEVVIERLSPDMEHDDDPASLHEAPGTSP